MAWNEDFIEMDSACRNQQGNCDEVEPGHFLLWLNLCNNSDRSNIVFQCINVCQVSREMLKTEAFSAFGLGFQHLPRDLANVNAWKTVWSLY